MGTAEWAVLLFPEQGRQQGENGGTRREQKGAVTGDLGWSAWSSSSARLETERLGCRESLEDFERDHHGLEELGEGRAGRIRGMEEKGA